MKLLQVIMVMAFALNLKAETPNWVNEVGPCDPSEICVVGSGDSLKSATSNGRSEMAKFFETKIKVDSKISNSTIQNGLDLNNAKFDEWSSKTISEEADELISGVETKKSVETNGNFYVLLSLSKIQTAKILKEKIDLIDKENVALFNRDSRFVYPLILLNLKKRNHYYDRYKLVSSVEINSIVSNDSMIDTITKLSPMKMALVSKNERLPISMTHMLENLFAPLKVVFVSKKQNPPYKLRTSLNYEDQYFKVEGFKKLNIIFNIELLDKRNTVLGRISTSSVQTARTKEVARDMALDDILNQLKVSLDQLASDNRGVTK